ncbi:acetyl-CoA C-acetyltransferase [Arthrobacter sp. efr-133-TYG-104]|uniref:acetyl-CoA C-acetyltransferase n=1 Tax=Arthrobacter sp. efr-133-TYG-104 TaxID=3040324 RepID=UPI002551BB22|nr:acetyl-CoA C-acetyltransferase [Arthrobacter sp. efr-133-TYG-104]
MSYSSTFPQQSPDDVVIVGGARTPHGRINGQLASLSAADLGAAAVAGALENAGVLPGQVDAVIVGQVVQAGSGQNPARQTAIKAGIGWNVPAITINKVCLSGLAAVIDASRMIRCGDADIVVAGGQESMSQSPHLLPGSRTGWAYGGSALIDSLAHDGLTDAHEGISMGTLTERGNSALTISRAQQDEVAAASHQRAARAAAEGILAQEIVPVAVRDRKRNTILIETDEGIRPETSAETLGSLRPAFADNGSITAGNSSPLSDGATSLVLARRSAAQRLDLEILAVIGASGQVAGPDNSLHSQPAQAIRSALVKASWGVNDLDFIEINEAFGAVAIQSLSELGIPLDRCNVNGGAIALGHPIGASGARLALHAALELNRRGEGRAAVGLCGGGGQGEALLLYRTN